MIDLRQDNFLSLRVQIVANEAKEINATIEAMAALGFVPKIIEDLPGERVRIIFLK